MPDFPLFPRSNKYFLHTSHPIYNCCYSDRFARNEVKTIIAVLITQFDLAIVDPPGVSPPKESVRGVFDTHETHGPSINGARAGG